MGKPNSTVVVLAGTVTDSIFSELDELPNVRALAIRPGAAGSARELVARAHTAYVVHDEDPLTDLRTAWTGFFDETVPSGTLEVAVEVARAALQRGTSALPDYFLVLDPDSLPATVKHWWFGVLASVAPSRVIPAAATAADIAHTLGRLPPGRWWPEPVDGWLAAIERFVPDVGAMGTIAVREPDSETQPT